MLGLVIINKSDSNIILHGYGEIGALMHTDGNAKILYTLYKSFWHVFKKLNTELPFDLVIPLIYIYSSETKMYVLTQNLCTDDHNIIIQNSYKVDNQISNY